MTCALISAPGSVGTFNISSNESSVHLSWEEPEDRNGPITQYTVTWVEDGLVGYGASVNSANITNPNITSFTLHDLASYTVYNITITAWTVIGEGDPSFTQAETGVSGKIKSVNALEY